MSEQNERFQAFVSSLTEETAPGLAPLLGWYWAGTQDRASVARLLARVDWEQSIGEVAEGVEADLRIWTDADDDLADALHWAQGFDFVLQCLGINSPRWDAVKQRISQEELGRTSNAVSQMEAYYAALPPVTGERLTLNIVD